jgi:hypothetical protein
LFNLQLFFASKFQQNQARWDFVEKIIRENSRRDVKGIEGYNKYKKKLRILLALPALFLI